MNEQELLDLEETELFQKLDDPRFLATATALVDQLRALEPKIGTPEAVFMIEVALLFDGIDVFATIADVLFGAGEVIKFFNNAIASLVLYFWVKMKGVTSVWVLWGSLCEFVPFIGNTLPLRTAFVVMTIYVDWHPKGRELLTKAAYLSAITPGAKPQFSLKNPPKEQAQVSIKEKATGQRLRLTITPPPTTPKEIKNENI